MKNINKEIETSVRFSVPIILKDERYISAEIKKPTGKVIADTKKATEGGDFFSSLKAFLFGCIESISTESGQIISDKVAIKSLLPKLPYKTAEQLALSIVSLYNSGDDDGIEGVYYCPRCNQKVIAKYEKTEDTEIDTRDFISDLEIGHYEGDGIIQVTLEESVVLKNARSKEVIEEITSFCIQFPTLEHGIQAYQRYGGSDEIRLQFAMFSQALVEVNDTPVDSRWKNNIGMFLFEGIKDVKKDLGEKVIGVINSYGIIPEVTKICPSCGKEWEAHISTSNFFASALRVI